MVITYFKLSFLAAVFTLGNAACINIQKNGMLEEKKGKEHHNALSTQERTDRIEFFIQDTQENVINHIGKVPNMSEYGSISSPTLNSVINYFTSIKVKMQNSSDLEEVNKIMLVFSPQKFLQAIKANKHIENFTSQKLIARYHQLLGLQLNNVSLSLKQRFIKNQREQNPFYLDGKTFAEEEKHYPIHSNLVSFSQAIFDSMAAEGVDDFVINYFKNQPKTVLLDIYRSVLNAVQPAEEVYCDYFFRQWKKSSIETLFNGYLPLATIDEKIKEQEIACFKNIDKVVEEAANQLQNIYNDIAQLEKKTWETFIQQTIVKFEEGSGLLFVKKKALEACEQQVMAALSTHWIQTAEMLATRMGLMFPIVLGRIQEPERVRIKLEEQRRKQLEIEHQEKLKKEKEYIQKIKEEDEQQQIQKDSNFSKFFTVFANLFSNSNPVVALSSDKEENKQPESMTNQQEANQGGWKSLSKFKLPKLQFHKSHAPKPMVAIKADENFSYQQQEKEKQNTLFSSSGDMRDQYTFLKYNFEAKLPSYVGATRAKLYYTVNVTSLEEGQGRFLWIIIHTLDHHGNRIQSYYPEMPFFLNAYETKSFELKSFDLCHEKEVQRIGDIQLEVRTKDTY